MNPDFEVRRNPDFKVRRNPDFKVRRNPDFEDRRSKILWFSCAILVFLMSSVFVGLIATQFSGFIGAIGISIVILVSAFVSGAGLGFLFGLPRVVTQGELEGKSIDNASQTLTGTDDHSATTKREAAEQKSIARRVLSSNTNLEKISDWLTTMLVGVGLTQLHNVNGLLLGFRSFLEEEAKVFPASCAGGNCDLTAGSLPVIGPIILIFGLVCGFLFMYLHTRLVLVRIFHQTETELEPELDPTHQKAVRATARSAAGPNVNSSFSEIATREELSVEDVLTLMFKLLYDVENKGYKKVIDLATKLSGSEATKRVSYWFYLAAAYGQKLRDLPKDNDSQKKEWAFTRENALDAARNAVAIDPEYKARLWSISNPDSYDNDLEALRKDEEFLKITSQERST